MSPEHAKIVVDALDATQRLSGAIVVQMARSVAGTRSEAHASFERAIALAKELVTRVELAQTLFAATPLEQEPVDSGAWTGRA